MAFKPNLGNLMRKASELWTSLQDETDEYESSRLVPPSQFGGYKVTRSLSDQMKQSDCSGGDSNVIFCKNNVCVHVPEKNDPEKIQHHAGYLTVKTVSDQSGELADTLILHWIPNDRIVKNSRSVGIIGAGESPVMGRDTTRRSPYHSRTPSPPPDNESMHDEDMCEHNSMRSSKDDGNKDTVSLTSHTDSGIIQDSDPNLLAPTGDLASHTHQGEEDGLNMERPDKLTLHPNYISNTPNIAVTPVQDEMRENDDGPHSSDTETTSNPDVAYDYDDGDDTNNTIIVNGNCDDDKGGIYDITTQSALLSVNPEFFALTHNLNFPECVGQQAEPTPTHSPRHTHRLIEKREPKCGVFSIDLAQMKCISIFYSDDECTSGQLVIASPESQYKILHFHHGGLDRLADTFASSSCLNVPKKTVNLDSASQCKQFYICRRSQLPADQCHPEEGVYDGLTIETWRSHVNDKGQIEDDVQLRKHIFFGGLSEALRSEAWPFLLHYYPFMSSYEEREMIRNDMYIKYQDIRKRREHMDDEERVEFTRTIINIVEKDVVRTDRLNPFFSGENNTNLGIMRNILLNYAVFNPLMGYTQGMSDLLAPLLAEIQHEADTFWCFVGLMQRTIFISTPRDHDMDHQLSYLRELIRLTLPSFYTHMTTSRDASELLFCHRWILLCFKREFSQCEALKMWEACWSQYQTDYFHLFICLAIIAIYGGECVRQQLPADEMLLYFNNLASHMNGFAVLRKARGLLHEFRCLSHVPCTLSNLCDMCGPGMWDSGHVPVIECVGHAQCEPGCPNNANSPEHVQDRRNL